MFRSTGDPIFSAEGPSPDASLGASPWLGGADLGGLAFVTLWTTGADPRRDAPFRLQALRRGAEDGSWEEFDRFADPFGGAENDGATARMAREFGVTRERLTEGPTPAEAAEELFAFVAGGPVVVGDGAAFRRWMEELVPDLALELPEVIDLSTLAGLLAPGRLASGGERLPALLCGPSSRLAGMPLAVGPTDLALALEVLIGRTLARGEAQLALLAHGWGPAIREGVAGASELRRALQVLEHPSRWRHTTQELYAGHRDLDDGRLSDAVRAYESLDDALDALKPAWAPSPSNSRRADPLPPYVEEGITKRLAEDDLRLVHEIFQEHLPRRFAELTELRGEASYREGQHQVAGEIAHAFGQRELLLVHAPTGTGKTLAYLIPTLLWALRHGVRVGVATFTRALQEQAMDRDVPLAVEMLRRAGVEDELRVALLKGRQNYLCWRALRLQAPLPDSPASEQLAWTTLTLFALGEADGDLDRLTQRAPGSLDGRGWRQAMTTLLGQVRSEVGCCHRNEDRDTCGAEAARRRAERAHLVITNHAFALARREFFRHLVFDECEHLHDVAHNAFSHAVSTKQLREFFGALWKPSGKRQPLNRVLSIAPAGSEGRRAADLCVHAREAAHAAVELLTEELQRFKIWREEFTGQRERSDEHSLFREYVLEQECDELLDAHGRLDGALNELAVGLAQLSEHLDSLPSRGMSRIRRSLDLLRGRLDELAAAVTAWIPRTEDGKPWFRGETFYDVEVNARGEDILAARVLLPHEYLGRHYFPDLAGAVLISATTWLGDGFGASRSYLGLERAASPDEEEERFPCDVRSFKAPEAFDYGRVIVTVPRDAPSLRDGKHAFLDYVARFVGYLAERTRGRTLVLFTNAEDLSRTARNLEGFFAERHLPLYHQRMRGSSKEELGERFRSQRDATLLGLDTFWYGADFPGKTLEYLVIVRLPYGVPDRYHHAQCASLGPKEQRRQIYMPRALAKLRQGFGRLMRKETDRGAVFLLDRRVLEPRHRGFLAELPLRKPFVEDSDEQLARFVPGETDRCLHEAFAHMGMLAETKRRGLDQPFSSFRLDQRTRDAGQEEPTLAPRPLEIAEEDLPY